jgi:choline dehydrogenase-like flavoprotein
MAIDYIVVGGGSAGCVIASRLSEDPEASVLLIEAGPEATEPLIDMPFAFSQLLKSDLDWDNESEREMGLRERRIHLARGKVIGGSSAINALIYMRGNRLDFDSWERAGNRGWSYDEVLPYFKKAEDNARWGDPFHGRGGPLAVADNPTPHDLTDAMIAGAVEAGIEANDDPNGADQDGAGRWQATQRGGRRSSTGRAYVDPVRSRPNLSVLTEATAIGLEFEGDRAVGVRYLHRGEAKTAGCEREVILAAGSFNSPQVLMLSGIGPAEDLAAFGIPCREDLPVGRNLQDHLIAMVNWRTERPSMNEAWTPENLERWERDGGGPIASNVGEGGAFIRVRPDAPAPDIQLTFCPVMVGHDFLSAPTDNALCVGPILLKPRARGAVTLRTALPTSKVRVHNAYLTDEEDRRTLVDGVRAALAIAEQPALRDVIAGPLLTPASDSYADCLEFVERNAHTLYHPVGTCSMGAVVDAECRVFGHQGLRVVDASVMPEIPRANTNAATIMIAERAADLIRGRG